MSEESSVGRQENKRRLRRRVLPEPGRQEVEDLDASLMRRRVGRFLRVLLLLVVILVIVAGYRTVMRTRKYTESTVSWENEEIAGTSANYENFGSNILKIGSDGVSCLSGDGTVLWTSGYTMTSPSVCIRGSYGAVADIQGQTAVIVGQDGVTGTVNTTQSILNVSVSAHGVLALVLDDKDVNYIAFYDNGGNELDIRIKTKLSGDGYPLDIALSPEGTGLMVSAVYLDQGSMQNQIAFYNFDVGKSESNRMVGYFTYGDCMFPEVTYLSDTLACAFGDDEVNLYSLKNESRPELIGSIPVEREILSVLSAEDRVGIITAGEESVGTLTVYSTSAREIFSADIEFEYTNAEFSGESTLLYNDSEILILGARGQTRFTGHVDGGIRKLVYSGTNSLLLFGPSSMKRLKLG